MKAFFVLLLLSFPFSASAFDQLEFGSRFDHFVLEKSGKGYKYKGQNLNLSDFNELLPLFSQSLEDDCGPLLKQRPDLTVNAVHKHAGPTGDAKAISRHFYIEAKTVSDGKKCTTVGGDGIYYVPLHRSWFDADKKASLGFGDQIEIIKGGESIARFRRDGKDWVDSRDDQFVNWDFYERFLKSLSDFPIDIRIHPAIAKDRLQFEVKSKGKSYVFSKIGTNLWAVKSPNVEWLLSNKAWSFFGDMDEAVWEDRFKSKLQLLLDRHHPLDERKSILKGLYRSWTNSIKRTLHKLILSKETPPDLKSLTLQMLKQKPSLDNFKVLVKALDSTSDVEFQSEITKVLRIREPKGPIMEVNLDPEQRRETLSFWRSWWSKMESQM